MNKIIVVVITAVLALSSCGDKKGARNTEIKTNRDSIAYAIGKDIGRSFEQNKLNDLNLDIIQMGIQDAFDKDSSKMTSKQIQAVMLAFQKEQRAAAEKERKIAADKKAEEDKITYKSNIEEGEKYLAENKTKKGVVTTESGLQYKIIKKGNGPIPKPTDKVNVHYKGSLLNGTVFDSSYDRGKPATFGVTQVIKGWTEALQLMPVGSKWELVIPNDIAYGARAAGKDITPYSTLKFEVELLSIEKAKPATK